MGPLFNPLYWFVGAAAVLLGVLLAVSVAVIAFLILRKATSRSSPGARTAALPIAAILGTVAFTVTTCSICNWALADPNLPQSKPRPEDIVGRWAPSQASLEKMAEAGGYPISTHEIIFNTNSTFVLTNMPDWWLNSFGESTGGFYSGEGTWEITQWQRGRWVIEARFSSLRAHGQTIHPTPAPWDSTAPLDGLRTFFDLSGREPPYAIIIYLGDPDSADVIVFRRLDNVLP